MANTTADKLTYLEETKAAIKDAIVSKGVTIPDGTTFRQYAGKIGEISGGPSVVDNSANASITAGTISLSVEIGTNPNGVLNDYASIVCFGFAESKDGRVIILVFYSSITGEVQVYSAETTGKGLSLVYTEKIDGSNSTAFISPPSLSNYDSIGLIWETVAVR